MASPGQNKRVVAATQSSQSSSVDFVCLPCFPLLLSLRIPSSGRHGRLRCHQGLRHLLLSVRACRYHGTRGAARSQLRRRRRRHDLAGGGDAAGDGADEDEGSAEARRRAGDPPEPAPRSRRLHLRHPVPVRHDGRPVQGFLRRHRPAVGRPEPRRQARWHILEHRIPRRRSGAHRADDDRAAGAPRDAVRADGVHVRERDVRDGGSEGRVLVRGGHLRGGRLSEAHRAGARPGLPPGPVHRPRRQEAQALTSRRRF